MNLCSYQLCYLGAKVHIYIKTITKIKFVPYLVTVFLLFPIIIDKGWHGVTHPRCRGEKEDVRLWIQVLTDFLHDVREFYGRASGQVGGNQLTDVFQGDVL